MRDFDSSGFSLKFLVPSLHVSTIHTEFDPAAWFIEFIFGLVVSPLTD